MKYSNVFWGVILITIGALIALRNFDIFYFSWRGIFNLWPLIFVFWGIAVLPIKALGKIALTAATVLIGLLILINHPYPNNNWHFKFFNHSYSSNDRNEQGNEEWERQQYGADFNHEFNKVDLHIDAAAGDFKLRGICSKLYEIQTEGNSIFNASLTDQHDSTARIDFTNEQISSSHNFKNRVDIQLNDQPIWILDIDLGAAKLNLDLRPFKIEKINIDGGASALKLKLGEKYKITKVNIDAGAAGIEISVPRESAVEVHTDTFLSGKDLDEFVKIDKGLYQTPNFSDTSNQIFIDIDAALSGVKIIRY